MIPKIIHQIWIGPSPAPQGWMRSWQEKNPSWQYKLWDNALCARTTFRCQKQIDAMTEWNGKADIIRYEILEREGGLCFDADSECVRPLDDHFLEHTCFACYEHEVQYPRRVATGYLGSVAHGLLVTEAVDRIARGACSDPHRRAWETVGPVFLTRLIEELGADRVGLHVYPSRTFIPDHWGAGPAPGDAVIYAKQYWGSTVGYPQ